MKRIMLLVAVAAMAVGCATGGRNTGAGTLLGAAIGAGTGAIVGNQTGSASEGAAIGAGLGALTGGLIGSALDRSEQDAELRAAETEAALYETANASRALSILDVIRLSQAGVSDGVIIAKIDQSGAVFDLSASEIIDLKRSSVSERVIAHMLERSPAGYSALQPKPRSRTVYRRTTYSTYPTIGGYYD